MVKNKDVVSRPNNNPTLTIPPNLAQIADILEHRIRIYCPTTHKVAEANPDAVKYVTQTLSFLARRFGGATSILASGAWLSHELELIQEPIYLCFSYATSTDLRKHFNAVVAYVIDLGEQLAQEAMALEIDNKLFLIYLTENKKQIDRRINHV